jgi:hypothetical protein
MRFNDCLYLELYNLLGQSQNKINNLKRQIDQYTNPSYTYRVVTEITNTWRLLDLTYQNIIRSLPFPLTLNEVNQQVYDPTLYQTNLPFLIDGGFQYPVYTYVWRMDLENSDLTTVAYHPLFPEGTTALQADVIIGSALASTALRNFAELIKTRPYSYQVFYIQFEWLGGLKRSFFMTYLPDPNKPYNNDPMSSEYNPLYMIGSGLL